MKHLKRYNESIEQGLDIEYIQMCFADLIDEYANKKITLQSDEGTIVSGYVHKMPKWEGDKESWSIRLKLWDDSDGDVTSAVYLQTYKVGYNLDKLVQEARVRIEILQDIDIAVKRLRDRYEYNILIDKEFTGFDTRGTGLTKQGWKEEFIVIRIKAK
jgi:hypothetical protein